MPVLLDRKQTHFVLWRPGISGNGPNLIIGTYNPGPPPSLIEAKSIAMNPSPLNSTLATPELWEIDAATCGLVDGQVYHYWFELVSNDVYETTGLTLRVADPVAYSVNWNLLSDPVPGHPSAGDDQESFRAPASVVRYLGGILVPADAISKPTTFTDKPDAPMASLPPNNRMVIYELSSAWTRTGDLVNATNVGVGTFQDVLALVDEAAPGANFADINVLAVGNAHLQKMGVNALELLPIADTFLDRDKWGYSTSNYFAPDFDLGQPLGQAESTAVSDLLNLVRACHATGIRFIYDAVMAFGKCDPYRVAAFLPMHVNFNANPPDPEMGNRDGFGGDLWKYAYLTPAFDPIGGNVGPLYPARQHMLTHMQWWMDFYHLDGYRLDSVNNINNYDFVNAFRTGARDIWNQRWIADGAGGNADACFITVGEELAMPSVLLGFIDGLWNEFFRNRVRNAIIGRNALDQPSFEWTVREMIDCRLIQGGAMFAAGHQAVNYVGSHDLTNTTSDGVNNDRLYTFLDRFGVTLKDKPIRLAFACLLTANGIPMILAGDEFASPMAFSATQPNADDAKQVDPVNYGLLVSDPWRASIFQYVSTLVKFRTTSDALSVDDTDFIHVDFTPGRRVMAWQRGNASQDPVVVVANFSDWGTDVSQPNAEYCISNWPPLPAGKKWRCINQYRDVTPGWEGREPIYPWEAKVYAAI